MRSKQVYIYSLTDPFDLKIKYIGKTVSPKRRIQEYNSIANMKRFKTKCTNWI